MKKKAKRKIWSTVQRLTIAERTEENSFAKQMAVLVARLDEQRLILEDLSKKLDAPPEEGLSKKLDALTMKAEEGSLGEKHIE